MIQTVVTRFDVDTVNRLTNLAKLTGRTKSYYIKEAVKEKLDDMELVYLAQSRSEDVRAGRSSTISLDELQEKFYPCGCLRRNTSPEHIGEDIVTAIPLRVDAVPTVGIAYFDSIVAEDADAHGVFLFGS